MSACRSCRAPLVWVRSEDGNKMPLDAEPYVGDEPGGLFVLRDGSYGETVALAVPPDAFPDEPLYRTHFATCPNADEWRKPR
jgi:hypothetical protein